MPQCHEQIDDSAQRTRSIKRVASAPEGGRDPRGSGRKLLDECTLARARFAGDEYQLSRARARMLQGSSKLLELLLPLEQRCVPGGTLQLSQDRGGERY